ncbi:MAG TPA: T9SS type A sorting domain-containing protein [Bacteroidales bacterium]|nr:T9SS type A sorting domain-containing protein [Bacteroidales bacterium]
MKRLLTLLSVFALLAGSLQAQTVCNVEIYESIDGYDVTLYAGYYATDTITGDSVIGDPVYTWYYDGMTFEGNVFTHTFAGPGTYTVCVDAITPDCGAEACQTIVIEDPGNDTTAMAVSLDYYYADATDDCSGVLSADVSGGTAPYTYEWSNGSTTEVTDGACSGLEYCVTVMDYSGLTAETCVYLDSVPNEDTTGLFVGLEYYYADEADDCSGVVTPYIYGGTVPYTFSWSNGETGEMVDNICAGEEICLTIEDANGAIAEDCVFLEWEEPADSCDIYLSYDITPASGWEIPDGSIDITVYGAAEPYTVTWSDSTFSEDFEDAYAGEYGVFISDANGCTYSQWFELPADVDDSTGWDEPLMVELYYYFADESDDCSAVVVPEVWGGTAPYTYSWSNGETSDMTDNICAGEMVCLVVEDALGETAEACINIDAEMPDDTTETDPFDVSIDTCVITGVIDVAEVTDVWFGESELWAAWEIIMGSDTIELSLSYGEVAEIEPGVYEFVLYINCGDMKSITTLSSSYYIDQSVLTVRSDATPEASLYPNPVRNVLNVQTGQSDKEFNILMLDANGRILNSRLVHGNGQTVQMATDHLSSGVYFIRITGNGQTQTLKFVK